MNSEILQTIVKYTISSGFVFIFLKYVGSVIFCFYKLKERRKKLSDIKTYIVGMVREDYASRGLGQSGMLNSAVGRYESELIDKHNQLNQYKWLGDNASSNKLISDFEAERESLKVYLENFHFHLKLNDFIEKILHTLSNAEILESRIVRSNRPDQHRTRQ